MIQQNVVSFSLFGKSEIYLAGALVNAALVRELLPDWSAVFFVGQDVPAATSSELLGLGAEVIMRVETRSLNPMFWRFEAFQMSGVERFISRDADSRISKREVDLIREWEASKRALHIIRDHPWHANMIMGGMWGLQGKQNFAKFQTCLESHGHRKIGYGSDQDFLSSVVYDAFKDDMLVHASFNAFESHAKRIPVARDWSFIGEKISELGEPDFPNRDVLKRFWLNPLRRLFHKIGHGYRVPN